MPELPSPEMRTFLNALEGFLEKPPGDLPDGAMDSIKELHSTLKGYTGNEELSPGEKEARQVPGSDTAVPYKDAAKGPDGPTPGQKEHADTLRQVADALAASSSE